MAFKMPLTLISFASPSEMKSQTLYLAGLDAENSKQIEVEAETETEGVKSPGEKHQWAWRGQIK